MKMVKTKQLNLYFSLFTIFMFLLFNALSWRTAEAMTKEPWEWLQKEKQVDDDNDPFGNGSDISVSGESSTMPERSMIYFGTDRLLWQSGLQGDFQTPFMSVPPDLGYIGVNVTEQKIYFSEFNNKWIRRMDLDGRNVEEVISKEQISTVLAQLQLSFDDIAKPNKIGFDTVDKKAYFALDTEMDIPPIGTIEASIIRVGLDGSFEEVVRSEDNRISGITVDDEINRSLYWFEEEETEQSLYGFITTVKGLELDSDTERTYLTGVEAYINGFDVDLTNNKIYWIAGLEKGDGMHYTLRRTNLNPSGAADVSANSGEIFLDLGTSWATKLFVDSDNNAVYWLQQQYFAADDEFVFAVYRANLDDVNPTAELVVRTDANNLNNVALSRNLRKVYWSTGDWIGSIFGMSLDGTEEAKNLTHLDSPGGIATDALNDTLYWTVPELGLIRRANLDGTEQVDILTGLNQPEDIVVDTADEKIYWTEAPRGEITVYHIRKANLDGGNQEVFYSWDEIQEIRGLALDSDGKTIYCTVQQNSWDDGRIRAVQTDKSDARWVTSGLNNPLGVAVDSVNRQVYWTEPLDGTIKRANLDGTRLEVVASGLTNPRDIEVDAQNQKLYWTANEKGGNIGLVQRANLDGTNAELITDDLHTSVKSIALWLTKERPTATGIYPTGDVNGDFEVDAYDAALILQFSVGIIDKLPVDEILGLSPNNMPPGNYEVSVPKIASRSGTRISVPVKLNTSTGFLAGGITLKYDTTVLKAVRVHLSLSSAYWEANTELDGEVRVAFVSLNSQLAERKQQNATWNTVFTIEFDVLSDTAGKETPLTLDYVELANSLSIKRNSGLFTVLPSSSQLYQNYPNPFNPETWIPYQLAADADVSISIYDTHGKIVRQFTLIDQPAGSYLTREKALHWDGRNSAGERVASDVYFYTLKAGDFVATRKMVILK